MNTVGFAGGHKPAVHKAPPKKADGHQSTPHFAGAAPAFGKHSAPAAPPPGKQAAPPPPHAKQDGHKGRFHAIH